MKDLLDNLNELKNINEKEFQDKWIFEKPVDSIFKSMEDLLIYDYNLGHHLLSDPMLNFGLYPSPNSTLQLEGSYVNNDGKILSMTCIEVGIDEEFSYSFLLEIIGKENRMGSGKINNLSDLSRLFNDIKYVLS